MSSPDPERPAFRFAVGPTVEGMDCGCGGCPECRPGVAEAAGVAELPFPEVLDLVRRAEDATLRRVVELRKPQPNRAEARRRSRAIAKASRRKDRT